MVQARTRLFGQWKKAMSLSDSFQDMKDNITDELSEFAENKKEEAVNLIKSGGAGSKPLHPFTVAQKGSSKPLVDSGTYFKSVVVKREDEEEVNSIFMGVDPNVAEVARSRKVGGGGGKKSLKEIAMIMELGNKQKITERMRKFLLSEGMRLSPQKRFINIPARPVFRKINTEIINSGGKEILNRIAEAIDDSLS